MTAFTQVEFTLSFIEFPGTGEFSFCAKRERPARHHDQPIEIN
jgi:hypothetical protein